MADLVGKTLKNRYEVLESLGRGGMAEVYKVWDNQRGVHLAMKVLREDLAEDRVFLRRFQREAENLSKLQHPNIVRFYGLEQDAHLAFILMEFIEGTTLRRQIFDTGGPMPVERVLQIMQPVCSALQYAHQTGLLHCDLKSGNIMLDEHGKVYLTDFGIARMSDAATATLVGAGTPAYMAPELVRGEEPTPQTDIYALGVVLYEMLTGGERPFTGEQATITGTTAEKVRWEQVNLPPTPPTIYNPDISSIMETAVFQTLEKEARKRFSSPVELFKALSKTPPKKPNPQFSQLTEETEQHHNLDALAEAGSLCLKAVEGILQGVDLSKENSEPLQSEHQLTKAAISMDESTGKNSLVFENNHENMTKLQDGVLEIQEVKADPISTQKKLLILAGLIITAFVLRRISFDLPFDLVISLVGSSLTGWVGSLMLSIPLLEYDFKSVLIVAIVNFVNSLIYKKLVFKHKNKDFRLIFVYFLQSVLYFHLILFLSSPSYFFAFYLESLRFLFPLTLISTGIFAVLPKSWRQPLW